MLNCRNPNTRNLRHMSWSKLLSTLEALELDYQYVVYIDNDCIFKDFDKTITDFIEPFPYRYIYFINNKPYLNYAPSSGFFISRVKGFSKFFIKHWYNRDFDSSFDINKCFELNALWAFFWSYIHDIYIINSCILEETENQFIRRIDTSHERFPYFYEFLNFFYFLSLFLPLYNNMI